MYTCALLTLTLFCRFVCIVVFLQRSICVLVWILHHKCIVICLLGLLSFLLKKHQPTHIISPLPQVAFQLSSTGHVPPLVTPEQIGTQVLKYLLDITAEYLGHDQVRRKKNMILRIWLYLFCLQKCRACFVQQIHTHALLLLICKLVFVFSTLFTLLTLF